MGVILLLQSFDPTGLTQKIVGSGSSYTGFDNGWYMKMGRSLCFTIMMSTFITNVKEIKSVGQVFLNRWFDRGFKFDIKKDLEDEDDDEPNTK